MDGAPTAEDAEEKLGEVIGGPQLRDGAARRLSGDDRRRGGPGDPSVAPGYEPPRRGGRGGVRRAGGGGGSAWTAGDDGRAWAAGDGGSAWAAGDRGSVRVAVGRGGGPARLRARGRVARGPRDRSGPCAAARSRRGRAGVRGARTRPLGAARSPWRPPAGRRGPPRTLPRPAGRHAAARPGRGPAGVAGHRGSRAVRRRGPRGVGGRGSRVAVGRRGARAVRRRRWGGRGCGAGGAGLGSGHDLAHGGPRSAARVIPGGNFAVGDLVRGGGAARQGRGRSGRGCREVHLSEWPGLRGARDARGGPGENRARDGRPGRHGRGPERGHPHVS